MGELGGSSFGSARFGGESSTPDDLLDGLIEGLPPGSYTREEDADHVRELAVWATGLGEEAFLQLDDLQDNALPDLAVETLADWERLLRRPPPAGADLPTRRARIIAACRERLGFRVAELQAMLAPALGTMTLYERTLDELALSATLQDWPAQAIPAGAGAIAAAAQYSYQEGAIQAAFRVYARITSARLDDLALDIIHSGGGIHRLAEAGSWTGAGTDWRWFTVYAGALSPSWRGLACCGSWTLRVTNVGGGGTGTIDEWRLELCGDGLGLQMHEACVYRSIGDPGAYDLELARTTARRVQHADTMVAVVDHLDFLTDDSGSLTDENVVSGM